MNAKRALGFYVLTIGVFAAAFAAVVHFAPAGSASALPEANGGLFEGMATSFKSPLSQILIQLLMVVASARVVGALFTKMAQPAVIGEMAVGVALGPTVLGAAFPSAQHFLFPPASLGTLSMLSQVGILLFMFVVGMELDINLVRRRAQSALLISHASIVLPFILGLGSALWLYHDYAGAKSAFLPFALFMGISMSITAFPVLARIIQERGLAGTELGNTAITCAAIDDVTAWTVLALIVALARAQNLAGSVTTVGFTLLFVLLVLCGARPLLQRVADGLPNLAQPGTNATVAMLIFVFACALCTEAAGIHALFGAFLAGIAMPRQEVLRHFLRERLEYFSTLFLLPVFFAFTGLRTQVGLLNSPKDWAVCGLLLTIAVAGKFGGSAGAARLTGMSWRDSAVIGAFLNPRGLVELIALNLGLDLGVLSPKIFAMLVLMALVTTFATGPIVSWLGIARLAAHGANEIGSDGSTLAR